MQKLIGKKIAISGMVIEIIADDGDKWKARNVTTQDEIAFDKAMIERAIKLGMAEEVVVES